MMYRSEVSLIEFREIGDARGKLVSLESGRSIPFDIARSYYIYGVESSQERGFHAHKNLKQVLICLHGKIKITYEYLGKVEEYTLCSPAQGLLIDSLVWHSMTFIDDNSVLMVLADNYYDESDYIRNYEEFKRLDAESFT